MLPDAQELQVQAPDLSEGLNQLQLLEKDFGVIDAVIASLEVIASFIPARLGRVNEQDCCTTFSMWIAFLTVESLICFLLAYLLLAITVQEDFLRCKTPIACLKEGLLASGSCPPL